MYLLQELFVFAGSFQSLWRPAARGSFSATSAHASRGGNGLEENCLSTHYKRMCTLYMLWEEHMPCLQVSVHAQTYVLST